jgi:hypothetical protein
MAQHEMKEGALLLASIIRQAPIYELSGSCVEILTDCAQRLDEFGAERLEYVILALHSMHVGFSQRHTSLFARAFSIGGVDSD